jgi:hypothetical protein
MENEKKKSQRPKAALVNEVLFTGVAFVAKKGRKKQLCIFQNPEEAIKFGIDKVTAKKMFLGIFGANNCVTNFSIFGNVSCDGSDDCLPGKTCVLQMWDRPTRSWKDHSEGGSAPVGGATWRCKCK